MKSGSYSRPVPKASGEEVKQSGRRGPADRARDLCGREAPEAAPRRGGAAAPRDGATDRTRDRYSPHSRSAERPGSGSRRNRPRGRGQPRQGSGIHAVPRKRLNASESAQIRPRGRFRTFSKLSSGDRTGRRAGEHVADGIDGQVAPAPAAEAGLGAVVEVIGPDVEDRHPPAEPGPGLRGDRLGPLDLRRAGQQRGLVPGRPAVELDVRQLEAVRIRGPPRGRSPDRYDRCCAGGSPR